MKKAIWRAKRQNQQTTRYMLMAGAKGTGKELGAYSCWDNARAEEASEAIERKMEKDAKAAGYQIVANEID